MQTETGYLQHLQQGRFSEGAKKAKTQICNVLIQHYFQRWIQPSDFVSDLGCAFRDSLNHVQCFRRLGEDIKSESPNFLQSRIALRLADAR
jgi:hypothetical protein